jgi:hypothetical protein
MRKVKYYCDRCGKEITGNVMRLTTCFIDPEADEVIDQEFGAELCRECYEIVDEATMKAVRDKEEKPTPKPKKINNRPAPNKVDIDMPKVFALRKAGWSLDKIGEEFGVSGQTIANHIAAYNSEQQKEVE